MEAGLPLPKDVWDRTPPEAQALLQSLMRGPGELQNDVNIASGR